MGFSESEIEKLISENIFALTYRKISSPQEELIETGILNSITLAELAVELEKTFSVSLSFMDINRENFCSSEKIKNLIQKKLL